MATGVWFIRLLSFRLRHQRSRNQHPLRRLRVTPHQALPHQDQILQLSLHQRLRRCVRSLRFQDQIHPHRHQSLQPIAEVISHSHRQPISLISTALNPPHFT